MRNRTIRLALSCAMDEQPVQLVEETRPPIAATKERPRRVDYEYERAGTASVFLFSEPAGGANQVVKARIAKQLRDVIEVYVREQVPFGPGWWEILRGHSLNEDA